MKESKTDRFRRVAEARVNKIIKMIRLLGNCSGTGVYEYTDTQVAYIFSALQSELDKAKRRFRKPSLGKHRFSLTDANEFDDDSPLEPTIALALPDGSYLRAVVYPRGRPVTDDIGTMGKVLLCDVSFVKKVGGGWYIIMKSCVSWGNSLCPSAWRASRRPMTAAGVRDMMHRKAVPHRAKVQK